MPPWCGYQAYTRVRQSIDSAHEFGLQFGILKMKHNCVMAKRLVLEQHDLCTIWSTENIVSGLMEENGLVFFFLSLKDISVSLLDGKFPVFFYTKGRQQVWGSAVLAVLVIQPWQWITGAAETYLPTSLRMLGKPGWGGVGVGWGHVPGNLCTPFQLISHKEKVWNLTSAESEWNGIIVLRRSGQTEKHKYCLLSFRSRT